MDRTTRRLFRRHAGAAPRGEEHHQPRVIGPNTTSRCPLSWRKAPLQVRGRLASLDVQWPLELRLATMEGFLSKMKAEVKAGVAKVESLSVESLESGVIGQANKMMEKVESGMMGKSGGESAATPSRSGGSKLTLDGLTRDELLVVARREKETTKRLKGELASAGALQ